MSKQSLQDRYAPQGVCFGCGPVNDQGLRIKSFPQGEEVVCDWQPEPHHEAFDGFVCGGIIGTLMDCHCNWTAIWHLMNKLGLDEAPATVTADYTIRMRRPTPSDQPIRLVAHVVDSGDDRAVVEGSLIAHGRECATCRGTFVIVKPGHPAYHRW